MAAHETVVSINLDVLSNLEKHLRNARTPLMGIMALLEHRSGWLDTLSVDSLYSLLDPIDLQLIEIEDLLKAEHDRLWVRDPDNPNLGRLRPGVQIMGGASHG